MARVILLHPFGTIHPRGSGLIFARPATTAPPPDALVWNQATSDTNFSYSYDRLTASLTGTPSGSDHLVRASGSNTSGYFEVLVVALGSGMAVGLTSSGASTSDFVGNANGVGWRQDGSVTRLASNLAVYSGYGAGDILGFCRKGNFLYLSRNGTWQGSADPSAGTGGLDVSAFPNEVLFPAASATSSTLSITGRFTAASLAYTIPTGVSAWDVTAVAASNEISGTSSLALSPSATATGLGTLGGSSALTLTASGTTTGLGTLAGSSTLVFADSGTATGLGTVAGSSSLVLAPSATATGLGSLAGTTALIFAQSGTATGLGALLGTTALTFSPSAVATGLGSLTGPSALVLTPSGTATGLGRLIGSSTVSLLDDIHNPAALTGLGSLLGSTSLSLGLSGAVNSASSNDLSGSASISFVSAATLFGIGQLQGAATISWSSSAALQGPNQIGGTSHLSLTLSGVLVDRVNFVVAPHPANVNVSTSASPSETNVIGLARPGKVPVTTASSADGTFVPAVKPARGQWRT